MTSIQGALQKEILLWPEVVQVSLESVSRTDEILQILNGTVSTHQVKVAQEFI